MARARGGGATHLPAPVRALRGRGWRAGLLVLLVALLAGGCVSEQQEQQLGDAMAAQLNQQLPLVRDPLLGAYVSRLGMLLAQESQRPDMNYRFYIVNSDLVNAFALPGGHVYVTRGLIERTRSGDELAGVLAHEIGHVAARHGIQKLERHLRTGSLVGVLYNLILGRVGGEPELLRQNPLQMASILWNASHSREDEQEADRLAVDYLIGAGVDPRGIVSLLQTLLAEEATDSTRRVASWFSTHPMTTSRIALTKEEIDEELQGGTPEADLRLTSYPAFLRRVAALPPAPDAMPHP